MLALRECFATPCLTLVSDNADYKDTFIRSRCRATTSANECILDANLRCIAIYTSRRSAVYGIL
jgi:hypothetical protein